MSKNKQKPLLIPNLQRSKAIGHLLRKTIPSPSTLHLYWCTLVSEQFKNQEDQISQISYLQFIPKTEGKPFRINITDVAISSTALYELMWSQSFRKQGKVQMGDSVGLSIAVNCLDYLTPTLSLHTKDSEQSRLKEQIKSETKKESLLKKEMSDIAEQQELKSNFGSDEDSLGGEKSLKVVLKSTNNDMLSEQKPYQYRFKEQRNILDYSESTKILIMTKLIEFLKIKENRIKKVPEIKYYLRGQKFNVPDKPLKQMIADLCGSAIMDRHRGYLLKQKYLTFEEIEERRNEDQRGKQEKLVKQRKKRGKRQGKNEESSEKSEVFFSQKQEFSSPFQELESRSQRRKKSGKKRGRGRLNE